ncbi:(3R)-3-hydroxyacyl-CoA dehydrogenase-like isoform X1 [Homalodisca vitripennis]|uniref:(3R)-3-hydroxyacyl-CoA dehydrogenase-like isoform X1 n=1 Tax=Homalodisca vitripennis TaxID=197043 RepID=UPI001EEB0B4B|nr:(3R)-3-hydroxyacyl-CoA dehydrogenase-like isoform X1 [Homalodisca vitripennis]
MVKGSLALVTGASSGMGRETCKVLAREGATVVVTCIDEAGAYETLKLLSGSGHSVFKYDVTNFQSAHELLKAIIQKYNRPPNILVNSAGILGAASTLDETIESFQKILDVNLKGTFFTCQAVCRELSAAKLPGAIVNISSVAARISVQEMAAYTASKAGVDAITKCMAKDMSQYNVRVNSVQPGWIETPMTVGLGVHCDMTAESWANRLATRRIGQPQEVAELIVFLSSDRASYINGSSISIDGGI